MADMRAFLAEHGQIVVKPLHGMGGRSIFVVRQGDLNANVIFETLTEYDTRHAIVQRYIPEIRQGDKRILLVNGEAAGARSGPGAGGGRQPRQPGDGRRPGGAAADRTGPLDRRRGRAPCCANAACCSPAST